MDFTFDGKPASNIGELTGIIGDIAREGDEAKAARLLDEYTEVLRTQTEDPNVKANPRGIAESNVGYLTGYLDRETMEKALALFSVKHPVFGDKPPGSPAEAVEAGARMGRARLRRR